MCVCMLFYFFIHVIFCLYIFFFSNNMLLYSIEIKCAVIEQIAYLEIRLKKLD